MSNPFGNLIYHGDRVICEHCDCETVIRSIEIITPSPVSFMPSSVISSSYTDTAMRKIRGEYIVRAVNTHERLVGFLEMQLKFAMRDWPSGDDHCQMMISEMKALLQEAKGNYNE